MYFQHFRSLYFFIIFAVFFLFISCSKKISFLQSAVVPAATGTVKIKTDKNKNYQLNLRVLHLAEPSSLPSPAKVYVVWMNTIGAPTKNLGQLRTSSNFFKRALTASLETVTTFSPSRIYITAEQDAAVSYPLGQEVLSTASL